MATLVGSSLLAVLLAFSLGSLLGRLGLSFGLARALLDILTQFRATLGFWLLAALCLQNGWVSPIIALGGAAGLIQAIPIARWVCLRSDSGELNAARAVALGQSTARHAAATTSRQGAAFAAALFAIVQVVIVAAGLRELAPAHAPLAEISIIPSLTLLPLLLIAEPLLRKLMARLPT